MALPVTIPNTFANATSSIPLSQLDTNFSTLANAVNGLNSGSETLANLKATTANVGVLTITGNATIGDASTDTVTLNSTLTANTAVIFAAGTSAAPSITTTGDTNTGIYFPAADTIAFAEGGAEAMRINSNSQVVTTAGTVSLPAITTTGDTNTGIFFPAADTIAFAEGGAEAMRIDSSGNVGIGVTPSAWSTTVPALQIGGGGAFLAALGSSPYVALGTNAHYNGTNFVYRTTNTASYYDQSSGLHRWYTAPSGTAGNTITFTQAMTLDASGNLGVGITPSAWRTSNSEKVIQFDTGSVYCNAGNDIYLNSNWYLNSSAQSIYIETDFATSYSQQDGNHIWYTAPSGTAGNTITFTERMRIDSSGRVGIANTSPSSYYQFADDLVIGSSGSTGLSIVSGTTSDGTIAFADGTSGADTYRGYIQYKHDVNALTFGTDGLERARITSGGRLEIASTGSVVTTSETLSVHGITGMGGTGSTTLYRLYVSNAAGSNATSPMIRFSTTDGIAGTIISTTTSTTYATSSDYRLKENIAPMTGALDKVAQLNPVTYNWKSNGSASQGFIAHELQAVCPDAVTGKKDETEIQQIEVSPAVPATYDEDGNELTPAVEATYEEREVPVYQGVDTSFLVATLTAAIQELKAITDAQATRIETLEAQNAAFEARLAALEAK